MPLPRSVLNALSNPRLLILVVILALLSRPVLSFNLKNVPKYSDNEKHRQSLGVNVRSRKNVLAGQSSNSIHRKEHKETQYSFAIQALSAESLEGEQLTSDALQKKRRRFLKLVAVPIIMCGFFYFYIIPSASAATAAATSASAASFAPIKATARNVLSERQSILIKGFISGACINFAKNILLHPIETVKARLDTGAKADMTVFYNVYSGIIPAILGGVPAAALFFGTKDLCRSIFIGPNFFVKMNPRTATILAVSLAQIPYWILRNPSEVLKTRIRTKKQSLEKNNNNDYNNNQNNQIIENEYESLNMKKIIKDIPRRKNILQEENKIKTAYDKIIDLYSGFRTNLLYALPSDWLKFLSYEMITKTFFGISVGQGISVSGLAACVCGSLAALISETVCTPLDVVRTRIMCVDGEENNLAQNVKTNNRSNNSKNPFLMLRNILESEGLGSLFKGWIPRSLRALLDGAVQFVAYELTQNLLNKHF